MKLKIGTELNSLEKKQNTNYKKYLNKKVYIDYPNLKTGFIVGFIFRNNDILC